MAIVLFKYSKTLVILLLVLISTSPVLAQDSSYERVSSLCKPADIQHVECKDDPRACAFTIRTSIERFFENYLVPLPEVLPSFRYPKNCLYRSYKTEVVNLSFDIRSNGKPINVKVLNTSNDCFSKSARNHIRKLRYESSNKGYSCVPWTLSISRQNLTDSSGNTY